MVQAIRKELLKVKHFMHFLRDHAPDEFGARPPAGLPSVPHLHRDRASPVRYLN